MEKMWGAAMFWRKRGNFVGSEGSARGRLPSVTTMSSKASAASSSAPSSRSTSTQLLIPVLPSSKRFNSHSTKTIGNSGGSPSASNTLPSANSGDKPLQDSVITINIKGGETHPCPALAVSPPHPPSSSTPPPLLVPILRLPGGGGDDSPPLTFSVPSNGTTSTRCSSSLSPPPSSGANDAASPTASPGSGHLLRERRLLSKRNSGNNAIEISSSTGNASPVTNGNSNKQKSGGKPVVSLVAPPPAATTSGSSSSSSFATVGSSTATSTNSSESHGSTSSKSRIFPSTRFFIALLLCLCYTALSISTSNIAVGMVCMVRRQQQQQQKPPQQNGPTPHYSVLPVQPPTRTGTSIGDNEHWGGKNARSHFSKQQMELFEHSNDWRKNSLSAEQQIDVAADLADVAEQGAEIEKRDNHKRDHLINPEDRLSDRKTGLLLRRSTVNATPKTPAPQTTTTEKTTTSQTTETTKASEKISSGTTSSSTPTPTTKTSTTLSGSSSTTPSMATTTPPSTTVDPETQALIDQLIKETLNVSTNTNNSTHSPLLNSTTTSVTVPVDGNGTFVPASPELVAALAQHLQLQLDPDEEAALQMLSGCEVASRIRKHVMAAAATANYISSGQEADREERGLSNVTPSPSSSQGESMSTLSFYDFIQQQQKEQQERMVALDAWTEHELDVLIESCHDAERLQWSSTDQGLVFAAQNAGSLLMLFTGTHADRLNSKWTIVVSLGFLVFSNAILPFLTSISIWSVVAARLLTGFADALLQPSTSSLITRWFPPKERPFAIGLITGGRQIGTLMILPVAGFLCSRRDIMSGWPAIFYLSALISALVLVIWLFCAADKPSKHCCTSVAERYFIEQKISEEKIGKRTDRKRVPWRRMGTSVPLHVAVFALICHEYPLVIMLQLLPIYINDVLKFSTLANGIVSALPIAVLFLSKTISSSLSSIIQARKNAQWQVSRTTLVKIFNGIASLGLGVSVGVVPLFNSPDQKVPAIIVLCLANAFAGLHTPGVQTALLQLAPAYTGIVTGIAFGFVGIFGIINKILNNWIVQEGTVSEWTLVFSIAAVVALLPVLVFSVWGSADRQHWASNANASAAGKHRKRRFSLASSNTVTFCSSECGEHHRKPTYSNLSLTLSTSGGGSGGTSSSGCGGGPPLSSTSASTTATTITTSSGSKKLSTVSSSSASSGTSSSSTTDLLSVSVTAHPLHPHLSPRSSTHSPGSKIVETGSLVKGGPPLTPVQRSPLQHQHLCPPSPLSDKMKKKLSSGGLPLAAFLPAAGAVGLVLDEELGEPPVQNTNASNGINEVEEEEEDEVVDDEAALGAALRLHMFLGDCATPLASPSPNNSNQNGSKSPGSASTSSSSLFNFGQRRPSMMDGLANMLIPAACSMVPHLMTSAGRDPSSPFADHLLRVNTAANAGLLGTQHRQRSVPKELNLLGLGGGGPSSPAAKYALHQQQRRRGGAGGWGRHLEALQEVETPIDEQHQTMGFGGGVNSGGSRDGQQQDDDEEAYGIAARRHSSKKRHSVAVILPHHHHQNNSLLMTTMAAALHQQQQENNEREQQHEQQKQLGEPHQETMLQELANADSSALQNTEVHVNECLKQEQQGSLTEKLAERSVTDGYELERHQQSEAKQKEHSCSNALPVTATTVVDNNGDVDAVVVVEAVPPKNTQNEHCVAAAEGEEARKEEGDQKQKASSELTTTTRTSAADEMPATAILPKRKSVVGFMLP